MNDWLFLASYALLWAIVVVTVLGMIAAVRELALVRLRVGPEPGALATNEGPKIGSVAPELAGTTLSGGQVRRSGPGPNTLLVFISPGCRPCRDLLPELARFLRRHPVETYIVSHGSRAETEALAGMFEIPAPLIVDSDNEVSAAFEVTATPFALAVDDEWTVRSKGVANNLAHLEALANFQVTPQGPRLWVKQDVAAASRPRIGGETDGLSRS